MRRNDIFLAGMAFSYHLSRTAAVRTPDLAAHTADYWLHHFRHQQELCMHGKARGASKAVGCESLELFKKRKVGARRNLSAATASGKWWRAREWQALFSYSSWSSGLMCFYIWWWSHVASHPRWSRLLHLPGVPNIQIAMARCDSGTPTVHEGIPTFKNEKPVTQFINMSDIWLVSGGIPLSSADGFCCFKLQTAGVAMVFFKWVLSQCFLCLGQSPGQPDLGEGIELNWVEDGETVLETRVTATPTMYSADSLLQARPLRLSWPWRSLESDLGGSMGLSTPLSLNLLAGSMALRYELETGKC